MTPWGTSGPPGDTHALNDHLYGGLESSYPVLAALAETLTRIDLNQSGQASPEAAKWPKAC